MRTERDKLISSIWRYVSHEAKEEIQEHLKNIANLEKGINGVRTQFKEMSKTYKELDESIIELSNNVTSVQPTVNEINKVLKSYGFLNFEIVPSESETNHYQIKREDGRLANSTLSEGEVTFITFLYYLQRAKGATDKGLISHERVLVIDDPISSLDSSVLFVVSTLLKELIKNVKNNIGNVKQIIVLTHNVYFHKEVSFVDGRTKENSETQYWIIRKLNRNSFICSYGMKNPIQSSYELLWREVKEWQKNSGITIQNTLRRIIENYFNILGSRRDDYIIQRFNTKEEQDICRSLLCWINDGSHCLPDDLYVERPENTIEKYLEVFKNIFYYTDNQGHYCMMMGIEELETVELTAS